MQRAVVMLLLAFGTVSICAAGDTGQLDRFEADATATSEDQARPGHHWPDRSECDSLGEFLGEVLLCVTVQSGVASWERVASPSERTTNVAPRESGEPLIPFVRLDTAYRPVESGVTAVDLRGEVGYGPFGLHVDHSHYAERHPADALDLVGAYGQYRMSFGSHVEVDLGVGAMVLAGNHTTTKPAVSLPILVHPYRFFGVEFRPAWADRVGDYDLGVLVTWRYASVKTGYRWVLTPHESLNGPYVGLSFRL